MTSDDGHGRLLGFFPGAISAECRGDGWADLRYPGEARSARCPVCARARLARTVQAFIPPRFSALIAVPPAVRSWAGQGTRAQGLYLAGPVGTGKTHAAWRATALWCLAAGVTPRDRLDDTGPTVVFSRMTDLLDDFRPGDDSLQRVRDCQHAALLVIDDLGAEKPSEWTQERLYSVVDHRYVNCLPLIVTGNLPPKDLSEQTGLRVASRLAEMCRVEPMTGRDRRRGAA